MEFVLFIVLIFIVCGLIQLYLNTSTTIRENGKHLAKK
ncbi:hypothetical protein NBRC111893_1048 [Lentilactobacillus kosonis]|uniref:Uncharacterized protein n=1 Tax=Lentilactobacillus kosonis TaxID=2810561 RepID=A0A401FKK6_9LACO|nr:hypothetical protein NBRC111893_1048 [Lentilactobacillus kosonis]